MSHFGEVIDPNFVGEPDKVYDYLKKIRYSGNESFLDGSISFERQLQYARFGRWVKGRRRMEYPVPVYIKTEGSLFQRYYWEDNSTKYKEILSKYPDAHVALSHGTVPFWKSFKQEMKFLPWYLLFSILSMIIIRTYLGTW